MRYVAIVASLVGVTHVASGDLLRELVKQETEQAREVKAYMDRGELVPDELTLAIVMARLSEPDCENGFILDGFPRTVAQARALDEELSATGHQIDRVINLEMGERGKEVDSLESQLLRQFKPGQVATLELIDRPSLDVVQGGLEPRTIEDGIASGQKVWSEMLLAFEHGTEPAAALTGERRSEGRRRERYQMLQAL